LGYAGLQPDDPREIGPYRLLGQLGSGGMGHVFLGMSAGGRPIAVKVIRAELATDPDFRARFRGEVAAAQKVSGLFTALVVDADLDGPMPWLATAYVAGLSLTEAVRGHGPLPARSLMALAAGLAEGLGAIHAAGVVHRDLKPSNVLLAEDGPRVIDFGISEAAEASVAGANVMIGSPGYMSPEQVLGVDIGPASDIFSLGAVLTFAATGQGPFGAGSHAALMYRLVNSPASVGDVPGELRSLVGRCLAKHPGDRPTAREMLAEVGALQPAPGWLAESIMSGFAEDGPDPKSAAAALGPAEASKLVAAAADQPLSSGQPPRSGKPLSGGTSRPGRHRVSRPLASAVLTGGLVVGSAVAAFALIGANRPPAGHHLQPQAGAGAVATVPASAGNSPASPGASSSASPSPSSSVLVSPSAYLSPASSTFTGTSMPPTPIAILSSGGSIGSSSPGRPPASSPPASSHPASSPPASSPPASSPPASSPPASSPPASSAPASSPPASSAPASSPPASSAPASSPPASSAPASSPPASSAPASSAPASSAPASSPASDPGSTLPSAPST
jgi:eukaryotic-like serine/threonine-protein kinase